MNPLYRRMWVSCVPLRIVAGEELEEVDGHKVTTEGRAEILAWLCRCKRLAMSLRPDLEPRRVFDAKSGLETSSMESLRLTWCDPPVLARKFKQRVPGDVLRSIGGQRVSGMSQQSIRELWASSTEFDSHSMMKVQSLAASTVLKRGLLGALEADKAPIHLGFECAGCGREPLIGTRFSCQDSQLHFCGACFAGRGHAHQHLHFLSEEHPGAESVEVKMVQQPTAGSEVVVIGTGGDHDGHLGQVMAEASGKWLVTVGDQELCLDPKHIFLRPGSGHASSAVPAAAVAASTAAASTEPAKAATSASPLIGLRFLPVTPPEAHLTRQPSARELRQVKGQEALQRFESGQAKEKATFLCKGACGRFVETEKVDYVKAGQLVMCQECSQKSAASETQASCKKCGGTFVFSHFMIQVEGRDLPTECPKCQETQQDGWAIMSPLLMS